MAAGLDRRKLELYLPANERAIGQARAFVDRFEAWTATRICASRCGCSSASSSRTRSSTARDATDARVRLSVAVDRQRTCGRRSATTAAASPRGKTTMPEAEAESGRGLGVPRRAREPLGRRPQRRDVRLVRARSSRRETRVELLLDSPAAVADRDAADGEQPLERTLRPGSGRTRASISSTTVGLCLSYRLSRSTGIAGRRLSPGSSTRT